MVDNGSNALTYVDAQIQALRTHTPAALTAYDATAIHQARVATRRLKAALDLFEPLCDSKDLDQLKQAGKKLRRRLGPMRDMDVMIDALERSQFPARLAAARDWLLFHCRATRMSIHARDREKESSADKLLKKFDQWFLVRAGLERQIDSVLPIVTQSLHDQFDHFSQDAARLLAQPEHLDVHQLRIDGKLLRYTIELIQAAGVKLPKRIVKQFKQLQEDLGQWHDAVVLAEQVMDVMHQQQILLHDAAASAGALDLAKFFVKQSERHLNAFVAHWKRIGPGIEAALHDQLPIVRVVTGTLPVPGEMIAAEAESGGQVEVSGSKTGRDRLSTPGTPRPESLLPGAEQAD